MLVSASPSPPTLVETELWEVEHASYKCAQYFTDLVFNIECN